VLHCVFLLLLIELSCCLSKISLSNTFSSW
jgi:hypothetical protein